MTVASSRRALAGLGVAAVLALGGCGVKAGDSVASQAGSSTTSPTTDLSAPTTSPTTESPTTDGGSGPTTTDGTGTTSPGGLPVSPQLEKTIADAYVQAGLTRAQATCLAHEVFGAFGNDMSKITDPKALTGLLDKCKISITDFGKHQPGA